MTNDTEPTEGEISAVIGELHSEANIPAVEVEEPVAAQLRFPFGFAKRHNVLISKDDNSFVLHCLDNVSQSAILETRRILRAPFRFDFLSLDDF